MPPIIIKNSLTPGRPSIPIPKNGERTYVATENGTLLGFGSIDRSGFLHYLFVNKNFLRKKTATALCDKLEKLCPRNIVTHLP